MQHTNQKCVFSLARLFLQPTRATTHILESLTKIGDVGGNSKVYDDVLDHIFLLKLTSWTQTFPFSSIQIIKHFSTVQSITLLKIYTTSACTTTSLLLCYTLVILCEIFKPYICSITVNNKLQMYCAEFCAHFH